MHPGTPFWTTSIRNSRETHTTRVPPSSFSFATNTAPQQQPQRHIQAPPPSPPQPMSEEADFGSMMDDVDGIQEESRGGPPGQPPPPGLASSFEGPPPVVHEEEDVALDIAAASSEPLSLQQQHPLHRDPHLLRQDPPPEEEAVVIKKKRKRRPPLVPWKKPKDMPRRPLSAYNLFFKERREAMMVVPRPSSPPASPTTAGPESNDPFFFGGAAAAAGPPHGAQQQQHHLNPKTAAAAARKQKKPSGKSVGIGFANLARTIASEWKELDAESKAPYEATASADKGRYDREMLVWRAKQKEDKAVGAGASAAEGVVAHSGSTPPSSPSAGRGGSNVTGPERFQEEAVHHRTASTASAASPPHSPSNRMIDEEGTATMAVGGAMIQPSSGSNIFSSDHHLDGPLAGTMSSSQQSQHHDMGDMMTMERVMHQHHQQQLLQQHYEHSMMMQEQLQEQQQQQQLGSPFGIPQGLSAMQMSELSSSAFRALSQQPSRHESPSLLRQHHQQGPAHDSSDFAHQQQQLFVQGNIHNASSFSRGARMEAPRNRMASMIGTIDEQFQHHSAGLPFNMGIGIGIGGGGGGGYAAESTFSHSSPELDYHHDSSLMDEQGNAGDQRMEHLMYAARRNTWSGLSQAQQHALQQQLALMDQQRQYEYQDQQQQVVYQQRRTTLGGMPFLGPPFGLATGGPTDRPIDFLRQEEEQQRRQQQQQQLFQQGLHGRGSLVSSTLPESWMEVSPERIGGPNRNLLQTVARDTEPVSPGEDAVVGRGQLTSTGATPAGRSSGSSGTLYPDTWFEADADANMVDASEAPVSQDDGEPLRYSPNGELNRKLPGKPSSHSAASRDRLTSKSTSSTQKIGADPPEGGSVKKGKTGTLSPSYHDQGKSIGTTGKGGLLLESLNYPTKTGGTAGDPLEYSEELQSQAQQPRGAGEGGTSVEANVNQHGQRLNPSSLQALGMSLDDETVDFLTKLRFSNHTTSASDHSSSPPTEN